MYRIVAVIIWTVLSGLTAFLSARVTNKRIKANKINSKLRIEHRDDAKSDEMSDGEQKDSEKEPTTVFQPAEYSFDAKTFLMLIAVVIVTAVCAYRITFAANSYISVIKLALSYLAVLSAAIFDFKTKTIPNLLSLMLIVERIVIFIYELVFTDEAAEYMISSIFGITVCFLVLSIAGKLAKQGIGSGDIKIISTFAFMCGINTVVSVLFFSLITCILISGLLILLNKRSKNDLIPFGPFIYTGCAIAYALLIL